MKFFALPGSMPESAAISFPNLGITLNPNNIAFIIFGKPIFWYGIIIACGFVLAYLYMTKRAKLYGLTADDALDAVLWAVPIGVVCARAYYCIFNWSVYAENPVSVFYIWEGGLAIYGGIIGGAIALTLMARHKHIPIPTVLDLAGPAVMIGQILGRWGNFFNREAHGCITSSFLKMGLCNADGTVTYYHPTFLYESVWNLLGFAILHFYAKHRKFDGAVFLFYAAWYGFGRLWIEGLRTDSLYFFSTNLRVSQIVAALSFGAAIAIYFTVRFVKNPKPEELYVCRKAKADAQTTQQL